MSDALDSQFRDTDRRVRDTDRRVDDLDSRLDDLEGDHERLKSRFGYTEDLDHELRSFATTSPAWRPRPRKSTAGPTSSMTASRPRSGR
ncbi:hypothetical protein ACIQUY_34925 [Streptomyces sp. NPDC090231]|uniref:hypothetical protein n=1 Tax=unclassified Streptomyces TaxID=2593676 RepID=UPI002E13F8F6|nr:hypothetical protein OG384_36515 [Streptomyces sp. NBC_01324]